MADEAVAEPVVGRTRWHRFLIVLAPAYAAVAALIFLAASGALAVSFAVSGTDLTITASDLSTGATDSNGIALYQYGVGDFAGNSTTSKGTVETVIPDASITNLCQSVTQFGVTVRTTAGTSTSSPVRANKLVVDANSISANTATFNNIQIGADMGQFANDLPGFPVARGSGPNVTTIPVPSGIFGQTATSASLGGLRQAAQGQSAGQLTLPGLSISIGNPC